MTNDSIFFTPPTRTIRTKAEAEAAAIDREVNDVLRRSKGATDVVASDDLLASFAANMNGRRLQVGDKSRNVQTIATANHGKMIVHHTPDRDQAQPHDNNGFGNERSAGSVDWAKQDAITNVGKPNDQGLGNIEAINASRGKVVANAGKSAAQRG